MGLNCRKFARLALASILAIAFAVPAGYAQDHVVSPSDLQKQVVNDTQLRQQNIDKVQRNGPASDANPARQS